MHKIIFRGEVLDGHDRDTVRIKLGQLFRIEDAARLDSLFSGKAVTIKKSLDEASARKYLAALEKAGALIEIEPPLAATPIGKTSEPLPDFTDFPEPSAQDLSFNTVMQSFSNEGTLAPEASTSEESQEESELEENDVPSKSWWPVAAGAGAALLVAAAFIFWPSAPAVKPPATATASTAASAPLSADEQAQLESLFAIAAEGSDEQFNQALANVSDPDTRRAMHELRQISGAEKVEAD